MIALAALLLLQADAPAVPAQPAAVPAARAPRPAPALRPLDLQAALDLFKALCWAHIRDADALRAAVPAAAVPLAEAAPPRPGPTTVWHADEAVLTYTAADDLPAQVPARQCTLRTRLTGPADQLSLAARIAQSLALRGGATRTTPSGATTTWTIPQPDGQALRLIVGTANAAGGQTDLRQLLLLLAPGASPAAPRNP